MASTIPTTDTRRYTTVAIILHWLIALGILANLVIGFVMANVTMATMTKFRWFQYHKSVGITVLLVALLRVLWRLGHRPPALVPMPKLERQAAEGAHVALYLFMLGIPLTGWVTVSVAKLDIPTVLWGVIPWPNVPFLSTLPDKKPVHEVVETLHGWGAYVLFGLIAIHAAAALRHHYMKRDATLWRMLPLVRRPLAVAALAAPLLALPGTARAATVWTLDAAHSTLGFTGSQSGDAFHGRFRHFTARIDFDPAHPADGHVLVSVDMTSATTGDSDRDSRLPDPDWFDASKYATATFDAPHLKPVGGDAYDAVGTLSLRGISHPLTLPFKLTVSGDTAHATGTVSIKRDDYGVGQGQWASGEWVALDVAVTFDITAMRGK